MPYQDSGKGKCQTCGFLSKQTTKPLPGSPNTSYFEVSAQERTSEVELTPIRDYTLGAVNTMLACFRHAYDLNVEAQEANPKAVVDRDRSCPSWYPYTDGLSPKEHLEELQMFALEERRKANDLRLFEMSQAVHKDSLKIAESSKNLVSDLKEIAEKSANSSRLVALLVVILALAQIAVGIMALYHESYADKFLRHIFGPLSR